jgi:3-deoxy-manno-octulosonate cytidylyltransferase (CMP-KDO synthetase)
MSTSFRVAIPARYASTRFPGKPLTPIAGRPMLEHVWRRACEAGAEEVVVATDDDRIAAAADGFGATVCMTRSDHASGTDRLAEVAQARGWPDDAIVVNLQGDEPLMPPVVLRQVAEDLAAFPDAALATLSVPIADADADERDEPNVVKVVTDRAGYALYFSRAPIPYPRMPAAAPAHRHLGIYAYRAGFLRRFSGLEPAPIERAEQLEQLRALWHGHRIHVTEAAAVPAAGVDAPGDVARVEAALRDDHSDA